MLAMPFAIFNELYFRQKYELISVLFNGTIWFATNYSSFIGWTYSSPCEFTPSKYAGRSGVSLPWEPFQFLLIKEKQTIEQVK